MLLRKILQSQLFCPQFYIRKGNTYSTKNRFKHTKLQIGSFTMLGGASCYLIFLSVTDDSLTYAHKSNSEIEHIYRRLPLRTASRLWGKLNDIDLPLWLRSPVYRCYSYLFNCRLDEACQQDLTSYHNLGEFFRRRIRMELRPIDLTCCLSSPVDARILCQGTVDNGLIEQVKGVTYSLREFLGPLSWSGTPQTLSPVIPIDEATYQRRLQLKPGHRLYQCVLYLAPGDYHSFHSPVDWTVKLRRYFSGNLLSVNPLIASWIEGLFSLNERAVYMGQWRYGFFSFTAVGATNVGSIHIGCDPHLHTNLPNNNISTEPQDLIFSKDIAETRGKFFGEFSLGSTIVLIFEAPDNFTFSCEPLETVKIRLDYSDGRGQVMWQLAGTSNGTTTFQSPSQQSSQSPALSTFSSGPPTTEAPLPPPPPPIAPLAPAALGLGGADSPYLLPPPPSTVTSAGSLTSFQPPAPPPPPPPTVAAVTSAGSSNLTLMTPPPPMPLLNSRITKPIGGTLLTSSTLSTQPTPIITTTSAPPPSTNHTTPTTNSTATNHNKPSILSNCGVGACAAPPGISPGGISVSSSVGTSQSGGTKESILCSTCGQYHDITASHLYDYNESIDTDLLCRICCQPLVDPLDTKCGHTFCTPCLKTHLAVQALCPVDKQIINFLECQQASNIVKRLLDKLLVVCPNVDYCEEVLPRCELESHLHYWCRGAVNPCPHARLGCTFQGPRSAHAAHKLECRFRQEAEDSASAGAPGSAGSNGNAGAGLANGMGASAGENAYSTGEKPPIADGEVTIIEIARGGHCDLGLSFVGGCDTPLMCIIIQEIYLDGIVTKDARLRPGDQILEVNGEDLTQATHAQAKRALSALNNICRLTVYREKAEESHPMDKEEIIVITLSKRNDKKLGIKLVGKKNRPGLYILGLVKNAEADLDGRLQKDDRILEINEVDLRGGTQDDAAEIICSATDRVAFTISRITRPQTPDIIRTASGENITDCASVLDSGGAVGGGDLFRKGSLARAAAICGQLVSIGKGAADSLGMSVAGGVNSQRGDTPIYVTNVTPDGVLGRTRQVKKGDILLAVNDTDLLRLPHERAVESLKSASIDSRQVQLRILEGPETSSGGGNFMPSWVYWLQLPRICQIPRIIVLPRDPSGSLGFSIVGGNDCIIRNSPTMGVRSGGCPTLTAAGLPQPIVVKSIVPGTPAFRDGRLKCGDIIISVNNFSLMDISHAHAVTLLKHCRGDVQLQVVSWPGTIV